MRDGVDGGWHGFCVSDLGAACGKPVCTTTFSLERIVGDIRQDEAGVHLLNNYYSYMR